MLSRAFRLTDKLSNALLRTAGWALAALALALHDWRIAWQNGIRRLWATLTHAITRTARTGQAAAAARTTKEQRRRATMARRAVAEDVFQIVREDPLKTQNRALSLFTVVLLALLIGFVWWFTGAAPTNGSAPPLGILPTLQPSATPGVAGVPTLVPTATAIGDPLRVGGSIVYAMHQRGVDNLWVIGIGQSSPIRLTNDAKDDRDPAWSHDGTRIAFASNRDGNWELYIMTVATGAIQRLTYTQGYEGHPVWSPDDKFIAYEGYVSNNLDIWVVPSDGSTEPQRLTQNAAPDFAPAWSPGAGRDIAYVSLRDGSPQIYDLNLGHLGNPTDSTALRLSNIPGIACDSPAWSPDGQQIAYSGRDANGLQLVYVASLAQPNAKPTVVGSGRDPAWAPNGQSLLTAVDRDNATTFIANEVGVVGVATTTLALEGRAGHPDWTAAALPASLLQHPPQSNPVAPPLYTASTATTPTAGVYNKLAVVLGDLPDLSLNEQVADSFTKLRQAVINKTGLDFLGSNIALWWAIQGANRHLPDPGQPLQNWHYAGRAFDFDRNLVYGSSDKPNVPPPVEVVREDNIDGQTYWRVYVRVPDTIQGLGEPLKQLPWDFASRSSQDTVAYQNGGRLKARVPSGYYVDFTALAADYGWQRVPAGREWRALATALLYWEFERRDGLTWDQAMQQLYPPDQIAAFLNGPTPVPTALNNPTVIVATRTPTPIPPDQLH
ncbi:MAG: TolB family protein [Aggregatilineales bacterium]